MQLSFNPKHPRVQKARFARALFKNNTKIAIDVAAFLLAIIGVLSIVFASRLSGFFLLAIVAGLLCLIIWREGELKELPAKLPNDNTSLDIAESLDKRALGRLKSIDTPYDIWQGIKGTWREKFFTIRYGIDQQFIEDHISREHQDVRKIWSDALELARAENQNSITTAALYVALLSNIPHYEDYIAKLHLESLDLIEGIDWQRHLELMSVRLADTDYFGGLARDWSAGFTPILNQLGKDISSEIQFAGGTLNRANPGHQQVVDNIINIMAQPGRNNIAIVGAPGTGKSTVVRSFAQSIISDNSDAPQSLRYHQVVQLSAGAILSQVNQLQTIESFTFQLMAEIQNAKNTILFFDEAEHFFNSKAGEVDLSTLLMPILQGDLADVRIIFSFTTDGWNQITNSHHSITSLLHKLVLAPTKEQETFRILEDQIVRIEHQKKVIFQYQALQEAYRLADRYINDSEFPGKAVKLLESAANYDENSIVSASSVQTAVEQTMGVKVGVAQEHEKEELLNLEDKIHEQMINQVRAVKVVSDSLRRARSGVNNPNKPVGTFMFLGPTGVGKTELAKAVGRVYFGGEDKLIRVDMNNYIQADDVSRLLAPSLENSTGLVAQISKNPFSVVLFDEIEKAHPDVVNTFLQLLDEGVLRDSSNKQISFKDAIIIATSNAGANKIRDYIEQGQQLEDFEEQFTNELIDEGLFKPEFLNRFDEMVVFRPLTNDELLQVVDLMIASVNRNLSRQKVQIELDHQAKVWLVENGNDPRLGARPLRRMVQRSVENIVARKLLQSEFRPGETLKLTEQDLVESQDL